MGEVTEEKFFIRSSNEGFLNRQSGVFDKLNMLEESHSVAIAAWKSDDGSDEIEDDIEVGCANKSGREPDDCDTFKVPIGFPPKRTSRPASSDSCPGYRAHPEKWTKYTLSNVTEESLSEDANSEAAMEFLTSRWKACNDYEDEDDNGKVDLDVSSDEKGSATGSTMLEFGKLLMPEYSVGKFGGKQSPRSLKRPKHNDANKNGTEGDPPKVKLSFLNSISHIQSADSTDAGHGTVEDCNPAIETVQQDVVSENSERPTSSSAAEDEKGQHNAPFRSIRKRKRNIRQTTFDHGGEDNVDDK